MGDSASILGRLYVLELRALARGRFVLIGAAALAVVVGFMAAVPATDGSHGLADFVSASAFLLPQFVGVLGAAVFASDRSSGFLDAVLTTPVRGATFVAARLFALATTAALLLAAWVPFGAIIAIFVGLPIGFWDHVLYAAGLALWCTLAGAVLGIALAGRGVGAATSTITALLILSAMLQFPVASLIPGQPTTTAQDLTVFVAHFSPHVLLKEALVMPLGRVHNAEPLRAGAAFGLELSLLAVSFLQLQSNQHAPARRSPLRFAGALGVVSLLALVPVVAGAAYEKAPEPVQLKPMVPFSMKTSGVFLLPGATIPDEAFDPLYPVTAATPIEFRTPTRRDLVFVLPLPANTTVRDLRVDIQEPPGMRVEGVPIHRATATATESASPVTRRAVAPPAGVEAAFAFRLPVTITLDDPQGFSSDWYFGELRISFSLGAEAFSDATAVPVAGHVDNGSLWMGSAALPSILAPALAAAHRSRRTRGG